MSTTSNQILFTEFISYTALVLTKGVVYIEHGSCTTS